MKLPLWSAFLGLTLLSFLFLFIPDYNINYILKFDGVMWFICCLVYVGEGVYEKWVQ